jgi:hypothetical protein
MGRYYIQNGGDILAEIDAVSPFIATCAEEAERAPLGSILVDLETGVAVAWRSELAPRLVAWSFSQHLDFHDEEATTSRRSVA